MKHGIQHAIESIERSEFDFRSRRAEVLGISIEELVRRDNRVALIAAKQKELNISWDEAEDFCNDMEMIAQEERGAR